MKSHREHRLPDGRILAWRERGDGMPLILLHGWSLSGSAFAELAGLLDGWRLLLPDFPGHGASSPDTTVTLASLADDIADWLDTVAPGQVLLGGWSLGGMVALELAARTGVPVDRLLLLATTPRFTATVDWPHGLPQGEVRVLRRNLERNFDATLGDFFARTFADGETDAARLREIRSFAVRGGRLPDPRTAAALLDRLAVQDQRLLVERIECPVLVMHGALDRVTPLGAGRALASALPRGELVEMTDVGHAPFWTRPHAVAATIKEFCAWGL